jgi:predicted secreted protein
MPAAAGKAAVLKISTTAGGAGTYTTCLGIENPSIQLDGAMLDVTELPATMIARIQGLKDAKVSAAGSYQPADTTGQLAIRNSWLNDTELWYQYFPDGTTGFKQQCKVSRFQVDTPVAGKSTVSIELQGTGAITIT